MTFWEKGHYKTTNGSPPVKKPEVMVPTVIMRSLRAPPSRRTPQERPTHSCITDPKVQSQPEDGPDIGPKRIVIILL